MNPQVDAYIARARLWPRELAALRTVLLGCGLDEGLKWGKPTYMQAGRNIAILQEMKDHLALMFFKGMLMDDPEGVLQEQGPNSRSARRMVFTSVDDVARLRDTVARYVAAAMAVEDAGLAPEPAPERELVDELRHRLDADPALRAAFEALTPGRRREYNLHIAEAKRAVTREERVARCAERMLAGKGLRDR